LDILGPAPRPRPRGGGGQTYEMW